MATLAAPSIVARRRSAGSACTRARPGSAWSAAVCCTRRCPSAATHEPASSRSAARSAPTAGGCCRPPTLEPITCTLSWHARRRPRRSCEPSRHGLTARRSSWASPRREASSGGGMGAPCTSGLASRSTAQPGTFSTSRTRPGEAFERLGASLPGPENRSLTLAALNAAARAAALVGSRGLVVGSRRRVGRLARPRGRLAPPRWSARCPRGLRRM